MTDMEQRIADFWESVRDHGWAYREDEARLLIDGLYEQFEASREATQKWYDEAHQQRAAINRALHELDQWVYADGTAAYRVERAETILRSALNPASTPDVSKGGTDA